MKRSLTVSALVFMLSANPVLAGEWTSCYARTYTPAELNQHKGQVITSIKLQLKAKPAGVDWGTTDFTGGIEAKLRNERGTWVESIVCEDKGNRLDCGVECDGGGFTLQRSGKQLILRNKEFFRLGKEGCGEDTFSVENTPGNRTYRLKEAKAAVCRGVAD